MAQKPWGITLACLVMVVAGISVIYGGIQMGQEVAGPTMMSASPMDAGTEDVEAGIADYVLPMSIGLAVAGSAIAMIILGAILFLFSYLIWTENELGWYAAVAFAGLGIVADLAFIALAGATLTSVSIIAIALSLLVLIGLFHRKTLERIKPEHVEYKGWDMAGVV